MIAMKQHRPFHTKKFSVKRHTWIVVQIYLHYLDRIALLEVYVHIMSVIHWKATRVIHTHRYVLYYTRSIHCTEKQHTA